MGYRRPSKRSNHFTSFETGMGSVFFKVWLEEPLTNFEKPLIFFPIVPERT